MYKKPNIAEEGGLKVHIEKLGGEWEVFEKFWDAPISDNALGRLVGHRRGSDFVGRTVKGWRKYYREVEL